MNVTVLKADDEAAVIEIELRHGGPYLHVAVRIPKDEPDSQFKRSFHARIRRTGPRGGHRGEPKTIGYTIFDIRRDA